MSIDLERVKCCILKGLHNCISSWYCKNGTNKLFFLGPTNNFNSKIDERIIHLVNNLHSHKHADCL